MAKNIFRFIIALVVGFILGQLLAMPIGAIIDLVYGYEVTGNNSPISFPNIIYIILMGFLSGFVAGGINKKKGMVIGGILPILPLFIVIGISIVLNNDIINAGYLVSWSCIELIPCIIGGYVGEKYVKEKMSAKEYIGGGIMMLAYIVAGILGLVIHVWTIVIAFMTSGLFAAVLTFIFPVLSEIYWFFKVGSSLGFGTNYCIVIMVHIGLFGVVFLGAKIAGNGENC